MSDDKRNRFVGEVDDIELVGRVVDVADLTTPEQQEQNRRHSEIMKQACSGIDETEDGAMASTTADTLALRIVPYAELNARQKELKNFHQAAAILAEYGFNSIKLSDDWKGADFLAIHVDGARMLRVQLKGRLTIDEKYVQKNLLVMFPVKSDWYLIEHDELMKKVGSTTDWLLTQAWLDTKNYHSAAPSKALLASLKSHRLGMIKVEIASDNR